MDIDNIIKQIDDKLRELDGNLVTNATTNHDNVVIEDKRVQDTNIDEKGLQVLNKIKNGEEVTALDMFKIKVEDLLLQDDSNITYLEYACKRKLPFSILKKSISNNKDALYICAKFNWLEWLYDISDENIIFEKVEGDNCIVDIILANNVKTPFFPTMLKKNYNIIDYLVKYNRDVFYLLSNELVTLLFVENNGVYPIDKYIDNDKIISQIIKKVPTDILFDYCKKRSKFNILKDAKEDVLLSDSGNGKTILEALLDMGVSPTFYGYDFANKQTLDILVNRGRIDLLYNADLNLLFLPYDSNRNYYELMIEYQKNGQNVNFEKMSENYSKYSSEMIAKKLILMTKNDVIGFIPEVSSKMLLYRNKNDNQSVLEWINELGDNEILNTIIEHCPDRKKPDFVLFLRNIGIDNTPIKIDNEEFQFSDECINAYNAEYSNGCISSCEDLLNELSELFYNDGVSDKNMIDALIISYRYLTSRNDDNAVLELRQLIEIKKFYYDEFTYTRISDGAYFNEDSGGVFLSNSIISTINHETSHALHYYLANNYTPSNYFEVIERVRNNPNTISLVNEYSKRFIEIKSKIADSVSKTDISDYYDSKYKDKKLIDLAKFLSSSKEEKKKKLNGRYADEVLDTILARTYSVDEFISQRKEIEMFEVTDAMLRNNYTAFICIGDIIDAIYLGKYRNGVLYDENRSYIPHAYGHGIEYYSRFKHGFDEMIANYGEIIKSKDANEMLIYLRSIVGDEVVDMIEDCYMNNILRSKVFLDDVNLEEKKSYGK